MDYIQLNLFQLLFPTQHRFPKKKTIGDNLCMLVMSSGCITDVVQAAVHSWLFK